MRPRLLLFTALAAIVLLAGCGSSLLPRTDISAYLSPPELTYSVDEQGSITVNPNTVIFTSRAGSLGALITVYRVDFFDASGNPLIEGYSPISPLGVRVPAGLQCTPPDDSGSCSINDPGVRFAERSTAPQTITVLPDDIARAHLQQAGPPGARAEITFFGTDDNGNRFELAPVMVLIFQAAN